VYDFDCFGQLVCNILKIVGEGIPCIFWVIFVIPIFFTKRNMLSNQVEREIIEQTSEWDDHTIVTWVYEGADVIYFPS
jgi:hypothetical protein